MIDVRKINDDLWICPKCQYNRKDIESLHFLPIALVNEGIAVQAFVKKYNVNFHNSDEGHLSVRKKSFDDQIPNLWLYD